MHAPGTTEQALEALADDLEAAGRRCAAVLVRNDERTEAEAVLFDAANASWGSRSERDAALAMVRAWGKGDDDAVLRGQRAWHASAGCDRCVVATVEGRSEHARCEFCRDDVGGSDFQVVS